MDYAYLHQNHHQFLHQDHQLPVILSSPPSLANNINCNIQNSLSSSCYGDSTTTWTPNSNTINSGSSCLSSLLLYPNNTLSSSVNHPQQQQEEEVNMPTQELTFNHWPEEAAFSGGAMKQELSPAVDPQFFCSTNGKRGGSTASRFISQIYPTINVPILNHNKNNQELEEAASANSLGNSRSLGMNNLQALDLFNSEHHQQFGFQSFPGIDHYHHNLQQATHQRTLFGNNFHNISAALSCHNNATTEGKRQGNGVEPKPPQAPLIKKSRLDPRVSCPPFKVRKEKLGDRIAALQQLVAPFGKTDTASVLMEAIGYIKFLQNQVETLSVPYMKSSRNKGCGSTMQGQWGQHEDNIETEETRRRGDLRSRGLCLVPLSCMSYVDDSCGGGGGGFWPPQSFGGS
ncbi:unnamed protein product [Cuscuta epithymum]|uniref:BHLH domain-containing protein n=1 Tax=Cuscuta epithymum TaxID=186058 RepID=A0AAV0C4C8_9ASTE|nr:unnamed protein product [Cuscuta epithymum]